ncbi:MAG: hypothetical protein ABI456_23445, partial [Ktedonobacteraceae bacterium]
AVIGVAAGLWARQRWPASLSWPLLNRAAPLLAGEFGLKVLYQALTQFSFWIVARLGAFDRRVFDTALGGIVKGVLVFTRVCAGIERQVFDAFAGALASATLVAVRASGRFDVRRFDGAVRDIGQGFLTLGQRVRVAQTGRIENYLLVALAWGLVVLAIAVLATFLR